MSVMDYDMPEMDYIHDIYAVCTNDHSDHKILNVLIDQLFI